jgi:AcrR family transcriptional regulator
MAAERRQLDLRKAATALAGDALTMAAIAREVGVAKPTLYRLAGSREALVGLCVDAEAERLLGHLHAAWDDVDAGVRAFASDSPGGLVLLFGGRHREARAAVRRIEDRLADLLRRAGWDGDATLEAARLLGAAGAAALRAAEDGMRAAGGTPTACVFGRDGKSTRGAGGTPTAYVFGRDGKSTRDPTP